jgi:hypothetical protein
MTNRILADILASVEVARIELEHASAGLAAQSGLYRWRAEDRELETMLASLRLARAALSTAQATITGADAAARVPARPLAMAAL